MNKMQLSISQFQADLINNSLKLYNIEMLSSSKEWREYDNLFDKLAELSDTSRADDFYKQSKRIKHGKDLDSLKITIIITNSVRVFAEVIYYFKGMK